jgi:hypothetical protein
LATDGDGSSDQTALSLLLQSLERRLFSDITADASPWMAGHGANADLGWSKKKSLAAALRLSSFLIASRRKLDQTCRDV